MRRQPSSRPQRRPANLHARQEPCQPVNLPCSPVGQKSSQSVSRAARQPPNLQSSQPMRRPLISSANQPPSQSRPSVIPHPRLLAPSPPLSSATSSSLVCIGPPPPPPLSSALLFSLLLFIFLMCKKARPVRIV